MYSNSNFRYMLIFILEKNCFGLLILNNLWQVSEIWLAILPNTTENIHTFFILLLQNLYLNEE